MFGKALSTRIRK